MGIIGLNLYISKNLHFPLWTLQGQVYLSFCGSNESKKKKTLPCVWWIYFIRIKGFGSTYKYNPTKKNSTSSVSLNNIFTALHKQIETPWLLDPIGIFKFCFIIIAVWSTEATKGGACCWSRRLIFTNFSKNYTRNSASWSHNIWKDFAGSCLLLTALRDIEQPSYYAPWLSP